MLVPFVMAFFLKKLYIMATKIRLARGGRKASAHYSIVVIESSRRQTGKFIEKIGHYHPLKSDTDSDRIVLKADRAKYWLSVGAVPTEVVIKFMRLLKIDGTEKYKVTKANPAHTGKSKKVVAAEKKAEKDAKIAAKKAKDELAKNAAKAEQSATDSNANYLG